jgi:hypothetical protein
MLSCRERKLLSKLKNVVLSKSVKALFCVNWYVLEIRKSIYNIKYNYGNQTGKIFFPLKKTDPRKQFFNNF